MKHTKSIKNKKSIGQIIVENTEKNIENAKKNGVAIFSSVSMSQHINPFAKMSKKMLKAAVEVDIDSHFNKKSTEKNKSAGNFLKLKTSKEAIA